jgi:hypothetical protein
MVVSGSDNLRFASVRCACARRGASRLGIGHLLRVDSPKNRSGSKEVPECRNRSRSTFATGPTRSSLQCRHSPPAGGGGAAGLPGATVRGAPTGNGGRPGQRAAPGGRVGRQVQRTSAARGGVSGTTRAAPNRRPQGGSSMLRSIRDRRAQADAIRELGLNRP